MKLDNRRIIFLEGAVMVILAITLIVLSHFGMIDSGYIMPWLLIGYLFLNTLVTRKLKAKYDPEALRREDEEDAKIQWVRVPFSITGCLCVCAPSWL